MKKELSLEAQKALDDGRVPRQWPQGWPRDSWRMQGVDHPRLWNRSHWSYRIFEKWKMEAKRRADKVSRKPRISLEEQAWKELKKLTKK